MDLDLSDREVIRVRCPDCGREYDRVVVFVARDGDAYAIASVVCHGHEDREVWIDVTFGSWVEPFDDHVSLSCRVSAEGAGAVDALVASRGEADHYGQRLTRDEALAHARLDDLWEVVDAVVTEVPEAAVAIYGAV
jgi:hypothetical protein